jgi:hypothetical protein
MPKNEQSPSVSNEADNLYFAAEALRAATCLQRGLNSAMRMGQAGDDAQRWKQAAWIRLHSGSKSIRLVFLGAFSHGVGTGGGGTGGVSGSCSVRTCGVSRDNFTRHAQRGEPQQGEPPTTATWLGGVQQPLGARGIPSPPVAFRRILAVSYVDQSRQLRQLAAAESPELTPCAQPWIAEKIRWSAQFGNLC